FVQDRMTLVEDSWYFTLGSKFGHNDYTGFEMQPTARLLWTPSERTSVWGGVSYAVRTPSRLEAEAQFTLPPPPGVPFFVQGGTNPNIEAEDLVAYEFGIRSQPSDEFFWDAAFYLNDYSDVATFTAVGPPGFARPPFAGFGLPFQFANNPAHRQTWGGELATTVQPSDAWNVRAVYSYFRGQGGLDGVTSSPRNLFYINSGHDIGCDVELNIIGRYQDVLAVAPAIPPYFEMDVQLGWRPLEDLEFTLVGRNLLDRAHSETPPDQAGGVVNEVVREFYGGVTYRY
ncbi:MAG: TonB-dependent receptor, partial [Planctomycetales bacterium]